MKRLCVFCGSNVGLAGKYIPAAQEVGTLIAQRGYELVYGGAQIGLMGAVADAALLAGGRVIGVIPDALARKEVAHADLSELHVVKTMHERKALMAELADGFLALPGGCGTFDELFEIVTWAQIGIHRKPYAVLNVCGYFDPLIALFEHAIEEQFVPRQHAALLLNDSSAERLLDRMEQYIPPDVPKWLDLEAL